MYIYTLPIPFHTGSTPAVQIIITNLLEWFYNDNKNETL